MNEISDLLDILREKIHLMNLMNREHDPEKIEQLKVKFNELVEMEELIK